MFSFQKNKSGTPSLHFVQKLEQQLRVNYREQFEAPVSQDRPLMVAENLRAPTAADGLLFFRPKSLWPRFIGYGLAFASGLAVVAVFLFNILFPNPLASQSAIQLDSNEVLTFDQGQAEEEILTNFENEMSQIDHGITLAVAP